MSETNGNRGRSADAFADALAELKEQGSMLLLAGRGHDALEAACEQLLGEAGPERRRRLFVLTDRTPTHAQSVEPTHTIAYDLPVRSAAATTAGSEAPERTVDGDLGDLQAAIGDAVAAIDREARGLDPAELRVCLDSADCLLAAHDRESLFRFVHALSGVVRDANAMCHVHLP
ncbi:MAG: hypothetical protein ABEH77_04305, partial [Halobacteriaceae archaeon]